MARYRRGRRSYSRRRGRRGRRGRSFGKPVRPWRIGLRL